MRVRSIALAGLALATGQEAIAARPLVTEDARILDPKACQVEAWIRKNDASREAWLAPACNPWSEGGAELSVGMARTRADGIENPTELVFQAKTLFRVMEPGGWGGGIVAGTVRHRLADGSREWYATIPLSVSTRDDRLVLHGNVGWLREQDTGRDRAVWGLAVEGQATERFTLLAETLGQNEGKPYYLAGFRFVAMPRVLFDAAFGSRFGSGREERWFSIGVHIDLPGVLP